MSYYNVPDKSPGDEWTSAEHNQLKSAHNDTESRLGTTETNVTGAQTAINALNVEQGSQNTVIAANTAQGAANNTRITDNDTDIAALQTGQAAQDTAIAALQTSQATQDAAIDSNTLRLDALGTSEFERSDISALYAATQGEFTPGDSVFVTDASADPNVTSGWAVYRYIGAVGFFGPYDATHWRKTACQETLSFKESWTVAPFLSAGFGISLNKCHYRANANTAQTGTIDQAAFVLGDVVRVTNIETATAVTTLDITSPLNPNFAEGDQLTSTLLVGPGEVVEVQFVAGDRWQVTSRTPGQPEDELEVVSALAFTVDDGLNNKTWFAGGGTGDQVATLDITAYEDNDTLTFAKGFSGTTGNLTINSVEIRNGSQVESSLVIERGQTAVLKRVNANFWHVVSLNPGADTSEIFDFFNRSTKQFTVTLSKGIAKNNQEVAALEDTGTGIGLFRFTDIVVPNKAQVVRLRINNIDAVHNHKAIVRFTGTGGNSDFHVNMNDGSTVLTTGGGANPATILSQSVNGSVGEYLVKFPAKGGTPNFVFYAAGGAAGTTGFSNATTGLTEVSMFDLNASIASQYIQIDETFYGNVSLRQTSAARNYDFTVNGGTAPTWGTVLDNGGELLTSSGGTLTHTGGDSDWDVGTSSNQEATSMAVTLTADSIPVGQFDGRYMFGLSRSQSVPAAPTTFAFDYALYVVEGLVRVFENGVQITAAQQAVTHAVGDVLEVRISGCEVQYVRNGEVFWTSTQPLATVEGEVQDLHTRLKTIEDQPVLPPIAQATGSFGGAATDGVKMGIDTSSGEAFFVNTAGNFASMSEVALNAGPFGGPATNQHKIGLDIVNKDIYFKNAAGNWELF